ncbi:MAG: B12-binding domain-containing radical SAM protein [Nitrospirae bacterium]|nr:B12-binding domain-containing radical SAM protein [Nitrospirota bacterium]
MESNILLLSSSFEDETRSATIHPDNHYPIGLGYIHSFLESNGHNVRTLFLNDYPFDDCLHIVEENIINNKPSIVGIQVLTNNRVSSFRVIDYLNNFHPSIYIVIGGIHASLMHEQILKKYPYVIAVLGEGEITFSELVKCIGTEKDIGSVNGIAYCDDHGNVIRTPQRELIPDLDALPFPKHSVFFQKNRKVAGILTSRGCPFLCSYCCLDTVSRRKVRYRSVDNVIREILYLKNSFPNLRTIWIHDDSFFLDNNRAISICDEIAKNKIKLKFICSGRMKPVSMNLVKSMERAGFTYVLLGLESGSGKILNNCHKGITPDDAINIFRLFKNSSIELATFLIVGLCGEDENSISETINLVQTLQKIKYTFYGDIGVLYIYPGTEIYEIAKKKHIIDDNYWMSDKPVPYFTAEHTVDKLFEFKNTILDSISFMRIFSERGFKAQRAMLPNAIVYCMKHPSLLYWFYKSNIRAWFVGYFKSHEKANAVSA